MSTKQIIILVILIAVVVVGYLVVAMRSPQEDADTLVPTPAVPNESAEILENVESVDLGDLDEEFNAIDTDLNSL